MAFVDDVAVKAAALKARAANLEAGVKQAAMQAMNPPPQSEYDTEALLARIDQLEGVGKQCDEPFEIKADGFTINCNSMTVDACGGSKPAVTFNTGAFNITTDGAAVTITDGDLTLTISGSSINVTGGYLRVGGKKVATEEWVEDNFAESDHTHQLP